MLKASYLAVLVCPYGHILFLHRAVDFIYKLIFMKSLRLKEHKTHHIGFRLTELEYAKLILALAEHEGFNRGEWCRAIVLEAMRKKDQPVVPFEQTLLEEFVALRSIISSVMFDLVTAINSHHRANESDYRSCRTVQVRESVSNHRPTAQTPRLGGEYKYRCHDIAYATNSHPFIARIASEQPMSRASQVAHSATLDIGCPSAKAWRL